MMLSDNQIKKKQSINNSSFQTFRNLFYQSKRKIAFIVTLINLLLISSLLIGSFVVINSKGKNKTIILSTSNANLSSLNPILFLNGYFYEPITWLEYTLSSTPQYTINKKIGEVTLDLKRTKLTGMPPDYSSSLNAGREVYSIKDIKKNRAVMVKDYNGLRVYYRSRKVILKKPQQLKLTVPKLFKMLFGTTKVSAVELRSDENGSWMRTSEDEQLLSVVNQELSESYLINACDMNIQEDLSDVIHINLMFPCGTGIPMSVYMDREYAYMFGAYIPLSHHFIDELRNFYNHGEQYPTITELLHDRDNDASYLYYSDYIKDKEKLCKNPLVERDYLYTLLNYYRVVETKVSENLKLVVKAKLGTSATDMKTVEFYERKDKSILIKIGEIYYKPAKGQMTYAELDQYCSSNYFMK